MAGAIQAGWTQMEQPAVGGTGDVRPVIAFFCTYSASQAPKSASPERTVLNFAGSYYYSCLDFARNFLPFLPRFSLLLESQSKGLVACLCIMGVFFAGVLCWIPMCGVSGVRSSWRVMLRVPIACRALVRAASVPRTITGRRTSCSFPSGADGHLLHPLLPCGRLPCLLGLPARQERSALPHSSAVPTHHTGNYIPFP